MDKEEFNKILIDELKLLFLKTRSPSNDFLEILLKSINPAMNYSQIEEYIKICKGKFSDFRYNYKKEILNKARNLEEFESLLNDIITENDCRQILASHLSCVYKESFEGNEVSLNELTNFVTKSMLIGIKSFYIPNFNVKEELKKLDYCTSSVRLQSRYHTNIVYNMD
ncbi:7300_t:CDS:2 [Rhizophagus irregularis]|nr:7300_t:CDS:2 [Rhizophagus irregularis]